ncbi:MAG: hypothetical protein ACQESF_03805 [Nanobdellota archaeon]
MPNKILIAAQAFGFGPSSKAATISAYLRKEDPNIHIDFVGGDLAFDLAQSKSHLYDNIHLADSFTAIEELMTEDYSKVISVMEPKTTFVAFDKEIEVDTIDSLFWFWQGSKIFKNTSKCQIRSSYSNKDISEIIKDFEKLHPHDTQLLGHLLTSKSYIQAYPNSGEREDLQMQDIENYSVVGPIVDSRFLNVDVPNDTILLSFCGQTNPQVTESQALGYCLFTLDLLSEGLGNFLNNRPNICLTIAGNSKIMQNLNKHMNQYKFANCEARNLNHNEYFKTLNRSVAVIGPPSITTMFEAFTYNKPYIFLPEQNDSHWYNYKGITSFSGQSLEDNLKGAFPGFLFSEIFQHLEDMPEEGITKIYDSIRELQNGSRNIKEYMKRRYEHIFENLCNNGGYRKLYSEQMTHLKSFKSFEINGAQQIAKDICQRLN